MTVKPSDIRDRAARVADLVLTKLSRPQPQGENVMAGNYFIGSDGRRRDFDSTGREIGSQSTTTGGPAPLRRPLPSPAAPAAQQDTGSIRPATPRPGLSRPVAATIQRPDVQATQADAKTNYGIPSLARPRPGAQPGQQLAARLAQPTYSPAPERAAQASLIDPRSTAGEMIRRARIASSDFHLRGGNKTRSQREQILASQAGERQFWLDQAASIPGGARRIGEIQAEQAGKGQLDAASQASAERVARTESAARLAAEQLQQQGAMDRAVVDGQFNLRRPQRPITLADGSLAAPGPDGTLQPYTMPDGSPAQAMLERPQVDQSALARLSTDLMPQFLGTDSYGMVPDATAEDGVRYPTQEERLAAFRQASTAARETLAGPGAPQPPRQRPSTSASPSVSAAPSSFDEFYERVAGENEGYSREELRAYFDRTYGSR